MYLQRIELNEKEIELLCENFVDEDRIREGYLSHYQQVALKELRGGISYIRKKYPELVYEIIHFAPATRLTGQGIIEIRLKGDELNTYKVFVIYDNTGEFNLSDTIYGAVLRDEYDHFITDMLGKIGIEAKAYTEFVTPVGTEVNAMTSIEEIISRGSDNVRYTDLFIEDTSDREKIYEEARRALTDKAIAAIYELSFVSGVMGQDIIDLEKQRSRLDSISFEV